MLHCMLSRHPAAGSIPILLGAPPQALPPSPPGLTAHSLRKLSELLFACQQTMPWGTRCPL